MTALFSRFTETRSTLAECPVWDWRIERLYWCDILGRRIHAHDWANGRALTWQMPDVVGSFGLTRHENVLIVALRDRVVLFDLRSGQSDTLTTIETENPRTRLNDGKVGPDGRFYVGTMDDNPDRQPIAALYRVTPAGECTLLFDGVTVSNGLAWSPDARTLYHADSRPGRIDAWDFSVDSGVVSNRRTFAQLTDETGRPDGGAVDAQGTYWSAGVSAGCINRFAPNGTLLERLAFPAPKPTMPCFCGPELTTLVITSLRPPSSNETDDETSGYLYQTAAPTRGLNGYLFGE